MPHITRVMWRTKCSNTSSRTRRRVGGDRGRDLHMHQRHLIPSTGAQMRTSPIRQRGRAPVLPHTCIPQDGNINLDVVGVRMVVWESRLSILVLLSFQEVSEESQDEGDAEGDTDHDVRDCGTTEAVRGRRRWIGEGCALYGDSFRDSIGPVSIQAYEVRRGLRT